MQSWQGSPSGARSRPSGRSGTLRLPPPVARYLGTYLQRLGSRIGANALVVTPAAAAPAEITRARAVLSDARQQMQSLLATPPDAGVPTAASVPTIAVQHDQVQHDDRLARVYDQRLARVEDVIRQLEVERQQLRSEVAALRLISEELRETLIRLDEHAASQVAGAPPPMAEPDRDAPPVTLPSPPPELVFPAGSVGIDVHLTAVEDAQTLERLRLAILKQPEVDSIHLTHREKDQATLRLYLRFPMGHHAFIDLLGRAAPAAKPLVGPSPVSLLLRLRPS